MLSSLQGRTNEALDDLRDLARGIYPPLLADRGSDDGARVASAQVAGRGLASTADQVPRYSQAVESAVYFSCLEALNNVAKYAEASHVSITLTAHDGSLTFEVR